MEIDQLDRFLAEANPWWRDPDWTARDVQLTRQRRAPFDYRPDVLSQLTQGGLYILRGPRRVGKSTEIKRCIVSLLERGIPPRRITYLSVEGWRAQDLEQAISRAAAQIAGEPGEGFWFLDEVTAVDGSWPAVVKRMRDSNIQFAEDTIVLSGSSAAQLEEATKALAGRRGAVTEADRVLFAMPFSDVARALGVAIPKVDPIPVGQLQADRAADLADEYRPWLPGVIDAWERYLMIGGYPQAVATYINRGSVDPSLTTTLFEIIHGDALARRDLSPAQTVSGLRALTRSLSSNLDTRSVAADMGVAQPTAAACLKDLRRSFIACPVYREQGMAPKPRSQPKWYFTDPLLAGIAESRGAGTRPPTPALNEQQVALSLLRAIERTSPTAALRHDQLLYYRSATRAEIDFVAHAFDGLCIESKYVDRSWGRAFQTIEASPYRAGIVATRSGLQRHDGGWALPAGLLAFLLGA